MFCGNCGIENADDAENCAQCNEPLRRGAPPARNPSTRPDIPNYMMHSIGVTLFCCGPLGIVAIVYASQVNAKLDLGDFVGAQRSSDRAKLWCRISVGLAAFVYLAVAVDAFLLTRNVP